MLLGRNSGGLLSEGPGGDGLRAVEEVFEVSTHPGILLVGPVGVHGRKLGEGAVERRDDVLAV